MSVETRISQDTMNDLESSLIEHQSKLLTVIADHFGNKDPTSKTTPEELIQKFLIPSKDTKLLKNEK